MKQDQWNSLRVGDDVFVHTEYGDVVPGKVSFVTDAEAPGEDNAVGMRIQEVEETYYTWPALTDVHTTVAEGAESCDRCRLMTSARPAETVR